jgi:hypothetical protein
LSLADRHCSNKLLISGGIWLTLVSLLAGCGTQPASSSAAQIDPIGIVTRLQGYPEVTRKERTYILANQSRIYPEDSIRTNKDSRLLITMNDQTTFALGPNSALVLHRYDYGENLTAPIAQMSFTRGAIRIRTGRIMKANQPKFEIRTPLAVIGVRGTDFWSGYLFGDNTLDVAMVSGKGIYVENEIGSIDLTTDGWGTTVTADSAPQPPKLWSSLKINRALTETNL